MCHVSKNSTLQTHAHKHPRPKPSCNGCCLACQCTYALLRDKFTSITLRYIKCHLIRQLVEWCWYDECDQKGPSLRETWIKIKECSHQLVWIGAFVATKWKTKQYNCTDAWLVRPHTYHRCKKTQHVANLNNALVLMTDDSPPMLSVNTDPLWSQICIDNNNQWHSNTWLQLRTSMHATDNSCLHVCYKHCASAMQHTYICHAIMPCFPRARGLWDQDWTFNTLQITYYGRCNSSSHKKINFFLTNLVGNFFPQLL